MKNFFKKFTTLLIGTIAWMKTVALVGAQITNPVIGDLGNDPEAAKDGSLFLSFFVNLWRVLINVGSITVIIYFLWGAIEWIGAGGDSGKIEKARQKITNSILGMVILVSSFTLIGFISQMLFGDNFNLLQLTFPTATVSGP